MPVASHFIDGKLYVNSVLGGTITAYNVKTKEILYKYEKKGFEPNGMCYHKRSKLIYVTMTGIEFFDKDSTGKSTGKQGVYVFDTELLSFFIFFVK